MRRGLFAHFSSRRLPPGSRTSRAARPHHHTTRRVTPTSCCGSERWPRLATAPSRPSKMISGRGTLLRNHQPPNKPASIRPCPAYPISASWNCPASSVLFFGLSLPVIARPFLHPANHLGLQPRFRILSDAPALREFPVPLHSPDGRASQRHKRFQFFESDVSHSWLPQLPTKAFRLSVWLYSTIALKCIDTNKTIASLNPVA
jgi:hypothetical protein